MEQVYERVSVQEMRRNQATYARNIRAGMWAWLLHRVTGLALVFYLVLHVWVLSSAIGGPATFDAMLGYLQTPFWVALDLGLLAAVTFHALNGLRLIFFDLGYGVRSQAALFWVVLILSALVVAFAGIRVWPHLAG